MHCVEERQWRQTGVSGETWVLAAPDGGNLGSGCPRRGEPGFWLPQTGGTWVLAAPDGLPSFETPSCAVSRGYQRSPEGRMSSTGSSSRGEERETGSLVFGQGTGKATGCQTRPCPSPPPPPSLPIPIPRTAVDRRWSSSSRIAPASRQYFMSHAAEPRHASSKVVNVAP